MTRAAFNVKHVFISRPVVPVYHDRVRDDDGDLTPVENVPGIELRLTCLLDGTFSCGNPKYQELWSKMNELRTLFEEAEAAEEGPLVWPKGTGPHTVTELVPKER